MAAFASFASKCLRVFASYFGLPVIQICAMTDGRFKLLDSLVVAANSG
jgi:hypothetical protein